MILVTNPKREKPAADETVEADAVEPAEPAEPAEPEAADEEA